MGGLLGDSVWGNGDESILFFIRIQILDYASFYKIFPAHLTPLDCLNVVAGKLWLQILYDDKRSPHAPLVTVDVEVAAAALALSNRVSNVNF